MAALLLRCCQQSQSYHHLLYSKDEAESTANHTTKLGTKLFYQKEQCYEQYLKKSSRIRILKQKV